MLSSEFLCDRILDFNRLDGFAEVGKRAAPIDKVSEGYKKEWGVAELTILVVV
jgi:hypothetical protein